MRRQSAMALFELVICLTIIGLCAGVLCGFLLKASVVARETTLRYELNNMRALLSLYRELKGRYPENLKVLLESQQRLKQSQRMGFGKDLFDAKGVDVQGYPIDPFGRRFSYNARKGVVYTGTKHYENW